MVYVTGSNVLWRIDLASDAPRWEEAREVARRLAHRLADVHRRADGEAGAEAERVAREAAVHAPAAEGEVAPHLVEKPLDVRGPVAARLSAVLRVPVRRVLVGPDGRSAAGSPRSSNSDARSGGTGNTSSTRCATA